MMAESGVMFSDRLQVRVTPELKAALKEKARELGLTESDLLRYVIGDHLQSDAERKRLRKAVGQE
jgi:antitoxin component of RelBE/YafQ-DinJ toxin-antitoxin module